MHHLAGKVWKCAWIFVQGLYLFPEANNFSESFEEQIVSKFKHTFTLNGGYRVYCPSNIFFNMLGFEN